MEWSSQDFQWLSSSQDFSWRLSWLKTVIEYTRCSVVFFGLDISIFLGFVALGGFFTLFLTIPWIRRSIGFRKYVYQNTRYLQIYTWFLSDDQCLVFDRLDDGLVESSFELGRVFRSSEANCKHLGFGFLIWKIIITTLWAKGSRKGQRFLAILS